MVVSKCTRQATERGRGTRERGDARRGLLLSPPPPTLVSCSRGARSHLEDRCHRRAPHLPPSPCRLLSLSAPIRGQMREREAETKRWRGSQRSRSRASRAFLQRKKERPPFGDRASPLHVAGREPMPNGNPFSGSTSSRTLLSLRPAPRSARARFLRFLPPFLHAGSGVRAEKAFPPTTRERGCGRTADNSVL